MESSPRDLAVLFRSLPRRRREALSGVDPDHPDLGDLLPEIETHVAATASLVGSGRTVDEVAEVLSARPAASWSDHELQHLREIGLHLGRLLRTLEERAQEIADRS